jgi:hypothetical protein
MRGGSLLDVYTVDFTTGLLRFETATHWLNEL